MAIATKIQDDLEQVGRHHPVFPSRSHQRSNRRLLRRGRNTVSAAVRRRCVGRKFAATEVVAESVLADAKATQPRVTFAFECQSPSCCIP